MILKRLIENIRADFKVLGAKFWVGVLMACLYCLLLTLLAFSYRTAQGCHG
jgi:hypothetical protein